MSQAPNLHFARQLLTEINGYFEPSTCKQYTVRDTKKFRSQGTKSKKLQTVVAIAKDYKQILKEEAKKI